MRKIIAACLLYVLAVGPVIGQTVAEQERWKIKPTVVVTQVSSESTDAPVALSTPEQTPVRSLILSDPMPFIDPAIVTAIANAQDMSSELKLAWGREYFSLIRSLSADSIARQNQRGDNWKTITLAIITAGLAIYGAAK